MIVALPLAALMVACSAPAPAPQHELPLAAATPAPPPAPSAAFESDPNGDWNLFPDPTTGEIDVYHKGRYLGGITGDEPAEQDPPLPHKTGHDRENEQD